MTNEPLTNSPNYRTGTVGLNMLTVNPDQMKEIVQNWIDDIWHDAQRAPRVTKVTHDPAYPEFKIMLEGRDASKT